MPRARDGVGEISGTEFARPAIDFEPPQDFDLPLKGRLQRHGLVPGAELIGVGVATQPLSEHTARGVGQSAAASLNAGNGSREVP